MTTEDEARAAQAAWLMYRDFGEMRHWPRRQLRRREFIAGYLAGAASRVSTPPADLDGILDRATLDEYLRVDADETYETLVVKANALASTVRRLLAEPVPAVPVPPREAPEPAFLASAKENGWTAEKLMAELGLAAPTEPAADSLTFDSDAIGEPTDLDGSPIPAPTEPEEKR